MAESSAKQTWSADGYQHHAGFVAKLGAGVLDWLSPQPGEHILDVGCGDGVLTKEVAEAGATVVGIDPAPDMIAAAKARGLDAHVGDVTALDFEHQFDAVFSNAALHWVTNAEQAAVNIAKSLRPDGRFVAEFGGFGNVAAIVTAMQAAAKHFGGDRALAHPWYFPTDTAYKALLERQGFEVKRIALIPRPTPLPTGLEGWLSVFRDPFFAQFSANERDKVKAFVVESLKPSLCDENGQWFADYMRLRVEAVRRA